MPMSASLLSREFLFFHFILFPIFLFAQEIDVSGVVMDADQNPLLGVNILLVSDESIGTISDLDGKFVISVPSTSTLRFKYLGYKSIDVNVAGQSFLNIVLETNSEQLATVEVTALGIKRQKRTIGYSTESFDGAQIERSNASNIISALSGKSAGVQIATPNGVDGGTARITIRGNNNLGSNNQPLIVIDGVPIENSPGMTNVGRGVDWGSAINNVNPADIESMNILKGPTASALYGSRGSNGVILITTKRGRTQKGIGVSYNLQHKVIQPFRFRDVQNVYGVGAPSTFLEPTFPLNADGMPKHPTSFYPDNGPLGEPTSSSFGFYGTGVSWGPRMEGQMIEWWDGEIRPFEAQPDNLKAYFNDGSTTTHNLAFSGGGEMGTMRVSLSRSDHKAIIPNSEYFQNTLSLGSNLAISKKLNADISINYINYHRLNSPTLGDDQNNSFAKGVLYSFPRSYKVLEKDINILSDGTKNDYNGRYPFLYSGPDIWWNTYNNNTTLDRNKLIGSLALNYTITDWLKFTGRLGLDFTLNQFETRNNPIDLQGIIGGYYSTELGRDIVNNNDLLLTANKEQIFNSKINVEASVGVNQWDRSQYGLRLGTGQWQNPWLFALENSDSRQLVVPAGGLEYRYNKKINSAFGFLNLSYDNYVFLELTGRNDWTSSLPLDNNSYFYPSASISFIATEAFDWNSGFMNFLKLRAAFAQTASDTDPFQIDKVYDIGSFGGLQTASSQSIIPPIALKPQRAYSYEVGANIGLWEERVNLDLSYYYINSYDQILDAPIPQSSGAGTIRINTGALENQGVEAIAEINIIQRKDFFWTTGFNVARNRNKVLSLGEDGAEQLILADIWGLNGPAIAVREGDDYGTIVGYDFIYHENGQPIVNDAGTHYLFTENRLPVGNSSPDFIGGWTTSLFFKGLSFNALIDTKWGGDIYSGSYVTGLQNGQSPETLIERQGGGLPFTDPDGNVRNVGIILPGVHADGSPNTEVVHYLFKYIPNSGGWGRWPTRPGIVENTYVKIRELSLSYEVKPVFLDRIKVFQELTLSLVGRDLGYLYTTLPDRINPEGINGSGNAQGIEWAAFPGIRSFGFSINARF